MPFNLRTAYKVNVQLNLVSNLPLTYYNLHSKYQSVPLYHVRVATQRGGNSYDKPTAKMD